MARSTKDAWLQGPGDLEEAVVEDVPVKGDSVLVRGLPAAYSNEAQSEALEQVQRGVDTVSRVNTAKMEEIQFAYGCVDPEFTVEEARVVSQKYGPAFKKIIKEIDRLSAVDKEAIAKAEDRFPASGSKAPGAGVDAPAGSGNGGSAVRDGDGGKPAQVRAGAADG